MTPTRRTVLLGTGALVLAAGGLGGAYTLLAEEPVRSTGRADIGGHFELVSDNGSPVTEETLRGKPSVIYFGYTFCPEVCPTTLADLTRWIKTLGPDAERLNYVFVSIDPERDTPDVMHQYVTFFDPHIRGFTGTTAQVERIAKEYHVYYKRVQTNGEGYLMDHSASLYLIDADAAFVDTIAYKEEDAVALGKLRQLIKGASS